MLFAGARLTNEELFLIQKLARYAVETNNISSFHYINRDKAFEIDYINNVSFENLNKSSAFYLIGSNISKDNAVLGYKLFNLQKTNHIPINIITNNNKYQDIHKANKVLKIKNYYYFIKAVNHYLLSNNLENKIFINDNCNNFETYKTQLLNEDFSDLLVKAECSKEDLINFAIDYNSQINAVIIASEKELSYASITEVINLSLITGKYSKTSMGLIVLKENANSYGLIDMGINPNFSTWKTKNSNSTNNIINKLENLDYDNLFIFGEDPIGCAKEKEKAKQYFSKKTFIVVQDYFLSETAKEANLILPASLPIEIGGSFTNSQHIIQNFEANKSFNNGPIINSINQIASIINILKNENNKYNTSNEVLEEALLSIEQVQNNNFVFTSTISDSGEALFDYGCDLLYKMAEEHLKIS